MKLPKILDVLGKDYCIVEMSQRKLAAVAEESPDTKVLGLCEYKKQLILLLNAMQKDCTLETLLHETLHALDGELGIGLSEKKVRQLSQGLYDVFKHNPETWKLIWRKR
jgi:hypothetical protein